ncbi:MAG TPA: hypothetical protein VF486_13625 [Actinomycetes bacterium]
MSSAEPLLDRRAIEDAFGRLGDRLARRGVVAMKVLAARRRDGDDVRFLIQRLGLTSVEQVLAVCADVFPDEPVPERARLVLEDALGAHPPDQDSAH